MATFRLQLGGTLAALCLSTAALAQPASERVAVDYSAPDACPAQDELARHVLERTSAGELVFEGDASRKFRVVIRERDGRFEGSLEELSSGSGQRRFVDADCREVVSALAVVLALALDPEGHSPPVASSPPEAAEPTEPAQPSEPPPPNAPVTPMPPLPPPSPPPLPEQRAVRGQLGPTVAVRAGVAPVPLVAAGLESHWRLGLGTGSFDPSVGLIVLGARTGLAAPADPDADYTWLVARAVLCPTRYAFTDAADLALCGELDAGFLRGAGQAISRPRSATGPWLSTGLGVRASWTPFLAFFLSSSASLHANLQRDSFVVDRPYAVVHEVPVASFGASVAAGWQFL